jgi:hypothetical protein
VINICEINLASVLVLTQGKKLTGRKAGVLPNRSYYKFPKPPSGGFYFLYIWLHIPSNMRISLRISAIFFAIVFISCGDANDKPKTPTVKVPVQNINPTPDQAARRKQSEEYCKVHGIPIYPNPNALFVDAEDSVNIRTKDEVVDRALALCFLGLKSEGLTADELSKFDKEYNISSKFSPNEKKYARTKEPTQQQTIDANWRYESLHVMLWALGFVDSLTYPDKMCVVADDVKHIFDNNENEFRQKATLRSKKEILDQADLILRIHWACVDARVNNAAMPGNLNASVVYERHYALNWLINYLNLDWDDVSTDT